MPMKCSKPRSRPPPPRRSPFYCKKNWVLNKKKKVVSKGGIFILKNQRERWEDHILTALVFAA